MASRGVKNGLNQAARLFDPDTFEPSVDAQTALSRLVGPAINKPFPASLEQLKQTHALTVLDVTAVQQRAEQIKFAHLFFTRLEQGKLGTVLRKGTGRGKSFDALIIAAKPVSENGRVLIVTSRNMLVRQFAEYARSIFNIDPDSVVEHSNSRIAVNARQHLHTNSSTRVVIATGETIRNDLQSGNLNPNDYDLMILDEGPHNTVGNYAYVPIVNSFRSAAVPFLALDATPANSTADLKRVAAIYGLDVYKDFFNVKGDTKYHPIPVRVDASKQVQTTAWKIAECIANCTDALTRPSTRANFLERTAGMTLFYAIRDSVYALLQEPLTQLKLREFIKSDLDNSVEQLKLLLRNKIDHLFQRHPPANLANTVAKFLSLELFEELKIENERSGNATLTPQIAKHFAANTAYAVAKSLQTRLLMVHSILHPQLDNFSDLAGDSSQSVVGPMRGLSVEINKYLNLKGLNLTTEGKFIRRFTSEAGELSRYHEDLTSYGAIFFLCEYTRKFLSFYARSKAGAATRMYESALYAPKSKMHQLASTLASGSAFESLLANPEILKSSEIENKINVARSYEIERGTLLTPKELKLYELIKSQLEEEPTKGILVFINQVNAASQFVETIQTLARKDAHLIDGVGRISANYVSGSGSMNSKMRQANKQQFEEGKVHVQVITSVAIEGAHYENADTLIAVSQLSNPGQLKQLMGRAGHGKSEGTIYQILAHSSPDERRLTRALERIKSAEEVNLSMTQIP